VGCFFSVKKVEVEHSLYVLTNSIAYLAHLRTKLSVCVKATIVAWWNAGLF
jgi:hypothetical protein